MTLPADIAINSKDQEPDPKSSAPSERARFKKFGTTEYQPHYADLVHKLLSGSSTAKNKSHCCAALQCSKPTLLKWMKDFPEFGKAITAGLELGKAKWYNKIQRHAFKPTGEVNNGLIKLLSSNIYGIKDEIPPAVILNQNIESSDPEKLMKEKGLPIPKIDNEDIND